MNLKNQPTKILGSGFCVPLLTASTKVRNSHTLEKNDRILV